MTDSSDDSADTVISVLDSRLSQSLSTSDSLSPEDLPSQITDNEKPQKSDVMGNRHGGEKKKKKEDLPQEKKPEDKPKKKGKKSKGKSKRNSQNVEGDLSSGQGACASPSSSTAKEKSRSRSKRPDVLADLGTKTTGSPLGSPESASGSQGTWSYDDESDVSTLGYSTPLLSTPQVQRYVLPKQTTPQQSSTERLEELGRSIEKTIVDKLSDRPTEEGATSALATKSSSDRKERRNVKKKRALGQAVIDSDSFTLPLQDVKSVQSERRSPQTQRLNTGTEKISLRASQESPVSPWLRDDDTPVDEEQMDEMFISCIDLSYNLADICSEKEFTEYGSLDSKKHAKGEKGRVKETSLSPRIARKANEANVSPWAKELSRIKNADSRETPPKSDSSTSTLAEAGCDRVQENDNTDLHKLDVIQMAAGTQEKATEDELQSVKLQLTHDSKESFSEDKDPSSVDKQPKVKKKTGKSKSKPKKKIKDNVAPIATNDSDIPTGSDSPKHTRAISGDKEKTDSVICDKAQQSKSDADNMLRKEGESCLDDLQQCVVDKNKKINSEDVSETFSPDRDTVMDEAVDAIDRNITEEGRSNESSCEIQTVNEKVNQDNCVPTKNIFPETDSKHFDPVPDSAPREYQVMAQAECLKNNGQTGSSQEPLQNVPKATESLSPQEPASPKHVPPPSPSAMDALAEIDEDDEEALEALEENSQLKEVQLFGETVFKRLSSLVESQSQDEDIEDRFNDFRDSDELPRGGTDSPPVNLGSMALLNGDVNGIPNPKASEVSEREGQEANKFQEEVVEEAVVAGSSLYVEKTNVEKFPEHHENISQLSNRDTLEGGSKDDNDVDIVDEGTLKRKKEKIWPEKREKRSRETEERSTRKCSEKTGNTYGVETGTGY